MNHKVSLRLISALWFDSIGILLAPQFPSNKILLTLFLLTNEKMITEERSSVANGVHHITVDAASGSCNSIARVRYSLDGLAHPVAFQKFKWNQHKAN
jgi:hypothetical protein